MLWLLCLLCLSLVVVSDVNSGLIFKLSFDELAGNSAGSRIELKDGSGSGKRAYCAPNACPKFGISGAINQASRFSGTQILQTSGLWLDDGTIALWYRYNGPSSGNYGATLTRPHGASTGSGNDIIFTGSPTFSMGRISYNPGWFSMGAADYTINQAVPSYSWGGYWCDRYWYLATNVGADSNWQHIAFTFYGAAVSIYYNGVLQGTIQTKTCSKNIQFIGGRSLNADYFNGDMDEYSVYSVPLSATDIKTLATH